MDLWSAVASAGIWFALPVTGCWCLQGLWELRGSRRWSPSARWGIASAVGLALWSLPLLVLAELGFYRSWGVGLAGWVTVVAFFLGRPRPKANVPTSPRWDRWDLTLAVGLTVAAGLLWGFPSESLLGGVDQGVYSNVGVFLERHGHLQVPLPSHDLDDGVPAFERMPGFRVHRPDEGGAAHLTPQFAHLFSVWLAQAYGTLALPGLFRLNGLFALLALACFYSTAVALVPRPVAVVATLFLAFNPAQLWVGRITLSEILAQVFVWSSLALIVRLGSRCGLRQDGAQQSELARWAGFLLALVALVRVDGFVLLPLLFVAQGATWLWGAEPREGEGSSVFPWQAVYQTSVPTFVFAAATYALWSPFYLEAMTSYLWPVVLVALVALYPVLAGTPRMRIVLQNLTDSKPLRVAAVVLLVGLSVWAYWGRPIPQPTDEESRQWYAERQAALAEGAEGAEGAEVSTESGPNWGRNTLSNLGRYLSPWVLTLMLLGVGRALWKTLQRRVDGGVLTLFVLWGGFTIAYLWDPAVDPLHYWAIRRFVPLVLPGCVLMAALGWHVVARRWTQGLGSRPSFALAGVLTLILIAHTVSVSGPLALFVRDQGVSRQLQEVAEALPSDDAILVPTLRPGWAKWQTPLYLIFERRLHPFDPADPRRMEKVGNWIKRQRRGGKPVYLLAEAGSLPEGCCPGKELVGRFPLNRQIFEPTYWPVPKTVRRTEVWLEIHRLRAR